MSLGFQMLHCLCCDSLSWFTSRFGLTLCFCCLVFWQLCRSLLLFLVYSSSVKLFFCSEHISLSLSFNYCSIQPSCFMPLWLLKLFILFVYGLVPFSSKVLNRISPNFNPNVNLMTYSLNPKQNLVWNPQKGILQKQAQLCHRCLYSSKHQDLKLLILNSKP